MHRDTCVLVLSHRQEPFCTARVAGALAARGARVIRLDTDALFASQEPGAYPLVLTPYSIVCSTGYEDSEISSTLKEAFTKILDEGQAGDNVGCLLRGTKREEIERGQVLCKPGSITPHTNFEANCYVLSKEEGGRHKPFFANYRPQFFFRTTDVTGTITLPEGTEMCMPGDNTQMSVELIAPIAMDEGLRFAIREGGRTVGAGRVTKINK